MNLGEKRLGNIEQSQKIAVPALAVDVEQHGSRGVGGVGRMHPAIGQVPEQETVDGAEGEFAAFRARPRTRHVIENPGKFGRREIRIEKQARAAANQRFGSSPPQSLAFGGGTTVLPYDGGVDWRAVRTFPNDSSFPLVRYAYRGNRRICLCNDLARGVQHVAPNRLRIVLDPSRLRIGLRKLALGAGEQPSRCVEEETPRRGRALVDREKMAHAGVPEGAG